MNRWSKGGDFRYFYVLKLHFDRLTVFPAALTLRHTIDDKSPLFGATVESLEASRALFIVSVVGIDPVIAASVQTQKITPGATSVSANASLKSTPNWNRGGLVSTDGRLHDTEAVG
jgi:inward rectifier potassium channel